MNGKDGMIGERAECKASRGWRSGCRPFRALVLMLWATWGVAPGYHIGPLWGGWMRTRRLGWGGKLVGLRARWAMGDEIGWI